MISQGYSDPRTLARRVKKMEAWLEAPELMEAGNRKEGTGEEGEDGGWRGTVGCKKYIMYICIWYIMIYIYI